MKCWNTILQKHNEFYTYIIIQIMIYVIILYDKKIYTENVTE